MTASMGVDAHGDLSHTAGISTTTYHPKVTDTLIREKNKAVFADHGEVRIQSTDSNLQSNGRPLWKNHLSGLIAVSMKAGLVADDIVTIKQN